MSVWYNIRNRGKDENVHKMCGQKDVATNVCGVGV